MTGPAVPCRTARRGRARRQGAAARGSTPPSAGPARDTVRHLGDCPQAKARPRLGARGSAGSRRYTGGVAIDEGPPTGSAPLFLLSFRQRDELAQIAGRAGWTTLAARRSDAVERRFLASGAGVAMVDARDSAPEGLAAVRTLADAAQANCAALLVLLARHDASVIAAAYEAGATHYLAAPFAEGELVQSLRFAARHADRLAGGHRAAADRARLVAEETPAWRWSPAQPQWIRLSPVLARLAGLPEAVHEIARGEARRLLGRGGARAAIQAIARLAGGDGAASFAHNLPGGGRVAHHLMRRDDGRIVGQIELLDGLRNGGSGSPRDPLTGLEDGHGARRWIEARLAGGMPAGAVAGTAPLVLMLLGLSRFDMVNAAFGRIIGDAIIRAVGRRIERIADRGNGRRRLVARLAGAEFAILLPAPATLDEAELLAAELVAAMGRPFVAGDHVVTLTARIGIAPALPGERDASELMRQASFALADAREGDATRVHVFTKGEESRRAEDRRLELDLRLALDEDRIEIVWQPQVSIATGRITGVEALARWRHPLLGELGAEALFAAAERSDYLVELSTHVQEKAIAIAAGWEGALARLSVSINVTAADIAEPGFAQALLGRIDGAGLARDRLTVEVTENGLIADLGLAAALLAGLRGEGLRVAIDDFGTGYSSLAYLKALPLDTIKIDRRLAQDIAGSARDRIVVRSVIDMARSLGLAVIAEGVETEEQLTLLAREGCNLYQGFLCSAPVDAAALAELLR